MEWHTAQGQSLTGALLVGLMGSVEGGCLTRDKQSWLFLLSTDAFTSEKTILEVTNVLRLRRLCYNTITTLVPFLHWMGSFALYYSVISKMRTVWKVLSSMNGWRIGEGRLLMCDLHWVFGLVLRKVGSFLLLLQRVVYNPVSRFGTMSMTPMRCMRKRVRRHCAGVEVLRNVSQ